MSFFIVDNNSGVKSTIKFGSYDVQAVVPDPKKNNNKLLSLVRTVSLSSWDVQANEIKVSYRDDKAAKKRLAELGSVRFEP